MATGGKGKPSSQKKITNTANDPTRREARDALHRIQNGLRELGEVVGEAIQDIPEIMRVFGLEEQQENGVAAENIPPNQPPL